MTVQMFRFSKFSRSILMIAISIFMIAGPLTSTVPVYGACATGLNPRLHITLLVPTSNPARRAWAGIVQSSLQCLGMDVSKVELPFSPNIYARALSPPTSVVGKTFDQGGFDILFVGYNLNIDPDPWSLYDSSQFAPAGQNYYLWNNPQNDNLSRTIKMTLDPTVRDPLVVKWQNLSYTELPSIPIFYDRGITAFQNTAYPNAQSVFSTYHFPAWPPIEHLSNQSCTQCKSTFTLAQTGQAPGESVIPQLSTSYYDLAISGEIFSGLALRNDTIPGTGQKMVPVLAAGTTQNPGWTHSADGKTWNVTIRPGVTWHDGQPFTAKDVKFTFDIYQNDTFAASTEAFVAGIVGGKNNVTINPLTPNVVTFHLPTPYAYFVQNILSTAILPEHILNRTSFYTNLGGKIDYSKIGNSLFSRPDNGAGGVNPVGTGPYKWADWNGGSSTAHLVRNDNYFNFSDWGTGALAAKHQFSVKDYYVQNILGSDQAITALKGGTVDFLDSQYHLETQTNFLSQWNQTAGRIAVYDDFGVQEMGVNMKHPILGTGTDTPYAQQHSGNATAAADAARWIRQAISYATPRDQIISQLLNGYGVQAITTPVVGNWQTGYKLTEGFNTNLKPYPYDLTKAGQLLQNAGYTPTYGQPFFTQYGIYIVSAVVIAAVAIAAVFLLRARSHRHVATTTATTTTTTTPPP